MDQPTTALVWQSIDRDHRRDDAGPDHLQLGDLAYEVEDHDIDKNANAADRPEFGDLTAHVREPALQPGRSAHSDCPAPSVLGSQWSHANQAFWVPAGPHNNRAPISLCL